MEDSGDDPGGRRPQRHGIDERPGPPPLPGQVVRIDRAVRRPGIPSASVLVLLMLIGAATASAAGLRAGRAGLALGFALLAAALGAGFGLRTTLARRVVAVRVRGVSMQPAFHDGDRVLVRRSTTLEVGQVVVVEQPAPDGRWPVPPLPATAGPAAVASRHWMIKRVVAVPGDPVPLVPALRRYVGGRVPTGRLVLLGDNRSDSLDSRQLGYFAVERTLGTVRRRLDRRW